MRRMNELGVSGEVTLLGRPPSPYLRMSASRRSFIAASADLTSVSEGSFRFGRLRDARQRQ